jgi:hypothetical protein
MKTTYWQRVKDYRFDPFCTTVNGKPVPPKTLPWLFPTMRVWLAALWYALDKDHVDKLLIKLNGGKYERT